MNNSNPCEVVTGKVRLSYVHLFKPYTPPGNSEPKYSVTVLLPKTDYATKQRIDAAIAAAIQQGIAGKWNGVRPPLPPIPIHDGDGVKPKDGTEFGPECKGHWVFTASSKQQVEIVDINGNPIIDQTQVYSGIFARVCIRFFAYNSNGSKGIGCGLYPVQKLEDGEPLGGRVSAAEAFGGAPAYPQQTNYGQPPTYPPSAPPQYGQPVPPAYPQQPAYGTPSQYGQPAPQGYGQAPYSPPVPQQPAYGQQQAQIDPITGRPIIGGIYGL